MKFYFLILISSIQLLHGQFFTTNKDVQRGDCRINPDQIVALVERMNPFLTEHQFDSTSKIETFKITPGKFVIIEQRACLRHHVDIQFIISAAETNILDPFFFENELFGLMNKLNYNKLDYLEYKTNFEKTFIRKFKEAGIGVIFNFPINDRTFIIQIEAGEWGAKIHMEMVKFIHNLNIEKKGTKEYLDDGWFKPAIVQNPNEKKK